MADLPTEIQTGKVRSYKIDERFGFLNWPDHPDVHFGFKRNERLLRGKKREEVENHEVRFYARQGDRGPDSLTAEFVEILGDTQPGSALVPAMSNVPVSTSTQPGLTAALSFGDFKTEDSRTEFRICVLPLRGGQAALGVTAQLQINNWDPDGPKSQVSSPPDGKVYFESGIITNLIDDVTFEVTLQEGAGPTATVHRKYRPLKDGNGHIVGLTADEIKIAVAEEPVRTNSSVPLIISPEGECLRSCNGRYSLTLINPDSTKRTAELTFARKVTVINARNQNELCKNAMFCEVPVATTVTLIIVFKGLENDLTVTDVQAKQTVTKHIQHSMGREE